MLTLEATQWQLPDMVPGTAALSRKRNAAFV